MKCIIPELFFLPSFIKLFETCYRYSLIHPDAEHIFDHLRLCHLNTLYAASTFQVTASTSQAEVASGSCQLTWVPATCEASRNSGLSSRPPHRIWFQRGPEAVRGKTHTEVSWSLATSGPKACSCSLHTHKARCAPLLNLIDKDLSMPHIGAQWNNNTHPRANDSGENK